METEGSHFFRCTDCCKEFSKRMHYNRHRKSHDRPYPCPLCGKAFGLKADRERHTVTHENISARFQCKFPNCRFRGTGRKDYFWKHLVDNHQLEGAGPSADKILRTHYNEVIRKAMPPSNASEKYFELIEAGKAGDDNKIRMLLSQSSNNSDVDSEVQKRAALYFAAQKGHATLAEILLKNGVDLEQKSKSGETALYMAIKAGHIAIVKVLVESGVDLEQKSRYGETALYTAIEAGHAAVVKVLVENGVDLEQKSRYGETALYMAIKAGHAAVVKVLVENGVDLEQKSRYGETALSMAIKAGHIAIVKVLLENGASIHGESSKVYGVSPLYMAVTHKQIEMVKLLIENSSIAEHISRDPDALIHAVKLNQKEIVELLLKCGTNPDQRVKGGYTPLESHVVWNYKIDNDVVRLLVEAGAKVTRFAWESFTLELREQYADRCPI